MTESISIFSTTRFFPILWRAALTFPLWIGLFSDSCNESHRIKSSWLYTSRTHHIWKYWRIVMQTTSSLIQFILWQDSKSQSTVHKHNFILSHYAPSTAIIHVHVPVWRWKKQTRNGALIKKCKHSTRIIWTLLLALSITWWCL